MKTKAVLVTTLIVSMAVVLGAGRVKESSINYLSGMTSENYVDREQAARAILQSRRETIRELEEIVRTFISDEGRKGTVKTAVVLLGKLRSVESVPLLAENLTLYVFYKDRKSTQSPEDAFPCVGALIEIGKPAIPEMLRNIQTSNDKKVRELSTRVIRYVEGPEIGRIVIEKAIEKQTDSRKKARLEAALSLAYFTAPEGIR